MSNILANNQIDTFFAVCHLAYQETACFSTLRMPAPVYFSIVADVPLLRILRGSGMNDMKVRDG